MLIALFLMVWCSVMCLVVLVWFVGWLLVFVWAVLLFGYDRLFMMCSVVFTLVWFLGLGLMCFVFYVTV